MRRPLKRKALNPSTVTQQRVYDTPNNLGEYSDDGSFDGDFDNWEEAAGGICEFANNQLELNYQQKYGSIQPNMKCNEYYYFF